MDINTIWALSGGIILGISAALIGCFSFINNRSLIGDALAHCALPGVLVAFLLTHTNRLSVTFWGGTIAALLGYFILDWLIKAKNIRPDSALAMVLSFFFSLGVLILSIIQRLPLPEKGGLDKLFFGQAAAILPEDILILTLVLSACIIGVTFMYQRMRACAFDRRFSTYAGLSPKFVDVLLGVLLVSVIVVGLQLVGVILMSALLLIPAITARQWCHRLFPLLLMALVCSSISVCFGIFISTQATRFPTGPWIVMGLTILFILSSLFAPRGILTRIRAKKIQHKRTLEEHLLRAGFLLNERYSLKKFALNQVLTVRDFPADKLFTTAKQLTSAGDLIQKDNYWELTDQGLAKASALTRHHRLWEQYLIEKAGVDKTQVHHMAEDAEHVITPEIASRLEAELNQRDKDPHGKTIPQT